MYSVHVHVYLEALFQPFNTMQCVEQIFNVLIYWALILRVFKTSVPLILLVHTLGEN